MNAPWEEYPGTTSIWGGWRQGTCEGYFADFRTWFASLTPHATQHTDFATRIHQTGMTGTTNSKTRCRSGKDDRVPVFRESYGRRINLLSPRGKVRFAKCSAHRRPFPFGFGFSAACVGARTGELSVPPCRRNRRSLRPHPSSRRGRLQRRPAVSPRSGLFQLRGQAQERCLVAVAADKMAADRQTVGIPIEGH